MKILLTLLLTALFAAPAGTVSALDKAARPDCAINAGPCEKIVNRLSVLFSITPRPVKVMSELVFTATVKDQGLPVMDADITIDLTMPGMFMGKNVVRLAHQAGGVYEGTGVIIRCPSGKKTWKATVTIWRNGKKSFASYVFEVQG